MERMRYVGIDYGEKLIGMAVADGEMMVATPRGVIMRSSDAQAISDIASMARKEQVGKIVIGVPLGHEGGETDISRAARAFGEKLRGAVGVPVEFENEIFTSRMAHHAGVAKENIDAASAAIILQSYLDKQNA